MYTHQLRSSFVNNETIAKDHQTLKKMNSRKKKSHNEQTIDLDETFNSKNRRTHKIYSDQELPRDSRR